jgi:hypothetical protein
VIQCQIHHGKIQVEQSTNNLRMYSCRCACGQCSIMNTVQECVCCREIGTIVGKINQLEDSSILCITAHPGFNFVCLNVWVLQTS